MPANDPVTELLAKILAISQSSSGIPQATRDDRIFRQFSCPPIIPQDDEDKGMWYIVNKAMDSLFGVENCKQNLRRGKYGIEVVLDYLKKAREHSSWSEDELLIPKLERIYKCFEDAGGVLNDEPPKKPPTKKSQKDINKQNEPSKAMKAVSSSSNLAPSTSMKPTSAPANNSSQPKKMIESSSSNPAAISDASKKRKSGSRREAHNLDFKLKVVQWHQDHKSTQQATALKFGINQTSLSRWLKEKSTIQKRVTYNGGTVKRQRTAAYPRLEQALYNWFLEAQSRQMPTNDEIL
ncbi:hypothetical protein Pst134EB_030073 [Puccinia striiformis f. sp. tritici]|nr:hypothetical protein Pst134EB_030073 [Puccinia striiformis f. sp. tritici]